jgi:hypothetical protein
MFTNSQHHAYQVYITPEVFKLKHFLEISLILRLPTDLHILCKEFKTFKTFFFEGLFTDSPKIMERTIRVENNFK